MLDLTRSHVIVMERVGLQSAAKDGASPQDEASSPPPATETAVEG